MKNLNSIIDTESKYVCFIGSNKYIITKIECWPLFKQDTFEYVIMYITRTTVSQDVQTRF